MINQKWEVSFPKGLGAPEKISLPKLFSLHRHEDEGVKYFLVQLLIKLTLL